MNSLHTLMQYNGQLFFKRVILSCRPNSKLFLTRGLITVLNTDYKSKSLIKPPHVFLKILSCMIGLKKHPICANGKIVYSRHFPVIIFETFQKKKFLEVPLKLFIMIFWKWNNLNISGVNFQTIQIHQSFAYHSSFCKI